MKFQFRQSVQVFAGVPPSHAVGFRAGSLHIASIAEAAERFVHAQLVRKREKTFHPVPPTTSLPSGK